MPALSFLAPLAFARFWADDLAQAQAGHLDFKLSAKGETLTLYASDRQTVLDQVTFGAQTPHASQGRLPDGEDAFVSFPPNRATPGASNFLPLTNVVVNELLTHTDPPFEDAVELLNLSGETVDLGNWYLSNNRNEPMRYRIPANTPIAPGGLRVFYQYQFDPLGLGFSFNSYQNEQVVLSAGDGNGQFTGYLSVLEVGPTQNGVSLGRFPTSQGNRLHRPERDNVRRGSAHLGGHLPLWNGQDERLPEGGTGSAQRSHVSSPGLDRERRGDRQSGRRVHRTA